MNVHRGAGDDEVAGVGTKLAAPQRRLVFQRRLMVFLVMFVDQHREEEREDG